jgi:site-specific DNA-cytosine methylase
MRPIGIDLFAGAGGLNLGFEQAGFDVAAAVEVDPVHCAVHKFNFPASAVICPKKMSQRRSDGHLGKAETVNQTFPRLQAAGPLHKQIIEGKKYRPVNPPSDQPLVASTKTSTSMRPTLATKTGRAAPHPMRILPCRSLVR